MNNEIERYAGVSIAERLDSLMVLKLQCQQTLKEIEKAERDAKSLLKLVNKTLSLTDKYEYEKGLVEFIARVLEISVGEIYQPKARNSTNKSKIILARKVISWVLRRHTTITAAAIGKLFGQGWDHANVLYHCGVVDDALDVFRRRGKDPTGIVGIINKIEKHLQESRN